MESEAIFSVVNSAGGYWASYLYRDMAQAVADRENARTNPAFPWRVVEEKRGTLVHPAQYTRI